MRTVRDDAGRHYVLLKASAESSLVRDPETGERRYVDNDALEPVAGESPLVAAARGVDEGDGRAVDEGEGDDESGDDGPELLGRVPDERALGLLVELDARGPLPVRTLLEYDLCESDLHGLLTELRAGGLIAEQTVAGERGYDLTEAAAAALAAATD